VSSIDDPGLSSQVWPPSRKEIIGWSGSRLDPLLNDRHSTLVQSRLTRIGRSPRGFVTGACVGIDQRVGVWLARVFPQYPEDHPKSQRSGTWQTIRMARAAHATAPFVFPLEEGQ
jgi:hypothetical protein